MRYWAVEITATVVVLAFWSFILWAVLRTVFSDVMPTYAAALLMAVVVYFIERMMRWRPGEPSGKASLALKERLVKSPGNN